MLNGRGSIYIRAHNLIFWFPSVVNEMIQLKSEFCDSTKIPDPLGRPWNQ